MDSTVPQRDFKLTGLIPWMMRGEPLAQQLKTPELRPVYQAATKNLWRGDAIVQTIVTSMYAGRAATGEVPVSPASVEDLYRIGLAQWQAVQSYHSMIELGVEGVLSTLLVQSWTTLETLVADLWEKALNSHPKILANLNGSKASTPRGDDQKQVALGILHRYNFNLTGRMGTLLREKYRFDSLGDPRRGSRRAYKDAFGDVQAILGPLNDPTLDALNAIRQVLVHRSGIVDVDYVEAIANLPAIAPRVSAGAALPLDGELVATLLLAGRPIAVDLLVAVDNWLANNP